MPYVAYGQSPIITRADAVRLALENNPEIESARQIWEGARARARQVGALPDPELELEYEEMPELGGVGDFGARNIGVVQRLEFPLKWWRRRQAGRQEAAATRLAAFETVRQDVRLRVGLAYDRIVLHQNILLRSRENLNLVQDILRKARIRHEAGDVPQLEVMRAEVEAGRATNQLTLVKNDLAAARSTLNALLARSLSTPLTVADSLEYQPLSLTLEKLKTMAVQQRPDLSGAKMQSISLRTRQAAAAAAYVPDLNIGVFRQRLRDGASEDDFWRLSFGLEVPLWAFSRQRAERAEVRAEVARTRADQEALLNRIYLETEQAYLDLTSAQEQVMLFQERILPQAEKAFEVASLSYDEGKATYLELLESRRTLTETHIEYAEALFSHRAAIAQLEWAVAGSLAK